MKIKSNSTLDVDLTDKIIVMKEKTLAKQHRIIDNLYKRMIIATKKLTPQEVEVSEENDENEPVTREDKLFESFAKEAMRELVKAGIADFVLLKNDKLRSWWQKVVKEELAEQARREAIEHKRQLKEQALAKLSDEEKEALGLTRKKK